MTTQIVVGKVIKLERTKSTRGGHSSFLLFLFLETVGLKRRRKRKHREVVFLDSGPFLAFLGLKPSSQVEGFYQITLPEGVTFTDCDDPQERVIVYDRHGNTCFHDIKLTHDDYGILQRQLPGSLSRCRALLVDTFGSYPYWRKYLQTAAGAAQMRDL